VNEQHEKIGLYVHPGVNDHGFDAVGCPVRGPVDRGGVVGITGGAAVGGSVACTDCKVQIGSCTKLVVPKKEYWHWIRALVAPKWETPINQRKCSISGVSVGKGTDDCAMLINAITVPALVGGGCTNIPRVTIQSKDHDR